MRWMGLYGGIGLGLGSIGGVPSFEGGLGRVLGLREGSRGRGVGWVYMLGSVDKQAFGSLVMEGVRVFSVWASIEVFSCLRASLTFVQCFCRSG